MNNKNKENKHTCDKCLDSGLMLSATNIMLCDMCGGGKHYKKPNYLNLISFDLAS